MRLKIRLQPSPKTKERRAMRVLAASAGLSIIVFSVFFIYLNVDNKKNAYAEGNPPAAEVSDNHMLNFTAAPIPGGVKLYWSTASEVDNDYFTLERSCDGLNFEAVDNIDGSGNTSQPVQYTYTDESPVGGINYYRLSQTDFEGAQKTFDPISVKIDDDAAILSVVNIYPNPFNGDFLLTYHSVDKETTLVEILNAKGKSVYSESVKSGSGVNVYDFNSKMQLTQGIYFVTLSQGKNKTEPIRIVKK